MVLEDGTGTGPITLVRESDGTDARCSPSRTGTKLADVEYTERENLASAYGLPRSAEADSALVAPYCKRAAFEAVVELLCCAEDILKGAETDVPPCLREARLWAEARHTSQG